jgi:hypothetical protein
MIEPNRPVYILQLWYTKPHDLLKELNDPLRYHGNCTLGPEPYSDVQFEWVACQANMSKKDEDGKTWYLKCMEPAEYRVSLSNDAHMDLDNGSYCHYHRPRVREDI